MTCRLPLRCIVLLVLVALAGCSTVDNRVAERIKSEALAKREALRAGKVEELPARAAPANAISGRDSAQKEDGAGDTRLVMAARYGQQEMVHQLLEQQVDTEGRDALGNTALLAAVGAGHRAIVRDLLQHRANVNAQSRDGTTALMVVSTRGDAAIADALLEAKADVNVRNADGEHALFYAVKYGQLAIVSKLLERGANPNLSLRTGRQEYRGFTPLMFAAQHGVQGEDGAQWLPMVRALLAAGADPNVERANGDTALSLARDRGYLDIAAVLDQAGARDGRRYAGLDNNQALLRAVEFNDQPKVQELLANRQNNHVDPDAMEQGVSALLMAATRGYLTIAGMLIKEGAGVNRAGRGVSEQRLANAALPERSKVLQREAGRGDTPLLTAVRNGHSAVVDLLLTHGADVNLPNRQAETPGLLAARLGHSEIMTLLLDHGLDPDLPIATEYNDFFIASILRQEQSRTLLIEAAMNNNAGTVRVLLQRGAHAGLRDPQGRVALSWSAANGNLDAVTALLDQDSVVDSRDNEGRTPLMLAAMNGHDTVVELLLQRGADVNAIDGQSRPYGQANNEGGRTALIHAARGGHAEVVRRLLAHGADVGLGAAHGDSALAVATRNGYKEIVNLLTAAQAR
ncbi:MAG: ankyrin repeat domain-containing protein [Gammaproteobacteria bacterium]|nr:ankyrin repeat domain-containing protein [Gammaproteobacteria bacterium]